MFGGGLAIAAGFRETGLATYLGEQLTVLDSLHLLITIACATLLILFLTEITSNTATATMILPVVAALALALNIHPFATEKLRIVEMVRTGFVMNIIAATLIVLVVYFLMPVLWNLDLSIVPDAFRL